MIVRDFIENIKTLDKDTEIYFGKPDELGLPRDVCEPEIEMVETVDTGKYYYRIVNKGN